MFTDYRNKNVNFYYVYSNIQHPETNGIVAPFSIKEKLMHVAEVKRRTGTNIPWICDRMDNQLKAALDASANAEFVIDPQGVIVKKRFWSNPVTLRADLVELVGAVENPTKVEDLETRFNIETREIASGVVPRLELPAGLKPIQTRPQLEEGGVPFFAKLRAEAGAELLKNGKGKLYLSLNIDPLYKVHWNNKMGAITITLEDADGVTFSQQTLVGPKVEAPIDIDPREFLIDVDMEQIDTTIKLTVDYPICDDAETFCMPVKQQRYELQIKKDKYGGTRPGIFLVGLFADVEKFDKNKDGILTKDELPAGKVSMYVGHMDKNENGQIDPEEISEFKAMFGNGQGFGRSKNDGAE